ncbi:hypothetical protein M885DRAFT_471370 [Pelagophyceae sp. CCMP2097]|nr:hypothetical protein M885DRAFT_471370 [Pelagophyceae sp. CCMP2097]
MAVEILGGLPAPVLRTVEPVGPGLLARCELKLQAKTPQKGGRDAAANALSASKVPVGPTRVISEDELDSHNHYELLGLEPFGIGVDDDMVRRAYHKALLLYHPDKIRGENEPGPAAAAGDDEQDAVFLAVQKAYQILSKQETRRAFDSTNKFDETIPSGREAADQGAKFDFYATYGAVFRSNARFAENVKEAPPPDLGDGEALEVDVDAFYEYWYTFESWRDFSLEAREHDPDAAEDRYEKRYMQKENEKLSKKAKKDEYARLLLLVDRAKANDPRLKQFKQARIDAKQFAKDEKARIIREAAEAIESEKAAAAQQAAEDDEASKADGKVAKAAREKAKKAKRRVEKLLAASATAARADGVKGALEYADLEALFEAFEADDLADVAAKIQDASLEAATAVLRSTFEAATHADPAERKRLLAALPTPPKSAPTAPVAPVEAPAAVQKAPPTKAAWRDDELSNLSKAAKKFSAGAGKRWEQISDYVNAQSKNSVGRSKEECISKFNDLAQNPAPLKAANGAAGWTDEQQRQLEAALAKHPSSLQKDERWKRIANDVEGKSKKDCADRYTEVAAKIKAEKAAAFKAKQ